jgi:hypothetical protein
MGAAFTRGLRPAPATGKTPESCTRAELNTAGIQKRQRENTYQHRWHTCTMRAVSVSGAMSDGVGTASALSAGRRT